MYNSSYNNIIIVVYSAQDKSIHLVISITFYTSRSQPCIFNIITVLHACSNSNTYMYIHASVTDILMYISIPAGRSIVLFTFWIVRSVSTVWIWRYCYKYTAVPGLRYMYMLAIIYTWTVCVQGRGNLPVELDISRTPDVDWN